MSKKLPLYKQLLDLSINLNKDVTRRKVNIDKTDGTMYSNEDTNVEDCYLKHDVAIVDLSIFDDLTANGAKMIVRVMKDMKRNNVFWLSGKTNANERRSIANLKKHEVLYETVHVGLFIVNPYKLRRGKPLASIHASLQYYNQDNSVEVLEDLYPPKRQLIAAGR